MDGNVCANEGKKGSPLLPLLMYKCNDQILQMKETTNPFSVAVFNDLLYWSDAKKRVVQAAHKIYGKNRHVLLKRPGQPFAVKVGKEL